MLQGGIEGLDWWEFKGLWGSLEEDAVDTGQGCLEGRKRNRQERGKGGGTGNYRDNKSKFYLNSKHSYKANSIKKIIRIKFSMLI